MSQNMTAVTQYGAGSVRNPQMRGNRNNVTFTPSMHEHPSTSPHFVSDAPTVNFVERKHAAMEQYVFLV